MYTKTFSVLLALALAITALTSASAQTRPDPPPSVRLYVFDCGTIGMMNPQNYDLRAEEIKGSLDFVTPCYLVVHPKGTLMWDVGQIPDANFPANGTPAKQSVFVSEHKLLPQLAAVGYKPSDITYLAMSHYHTDHTANANEFASATWIVQESERSAMLGQPGPRQAAPATFSKLKDAKTIAVHNEDHDVFGDGTVVLKFTPGHTPGHQSLFVKFAKAGPVVLAGDLYHYPEERSLDRIPSFDTDRELTRKSRKALDEFVKQNNAQLWIQHDAALYAILAKPPQYIE
ncbi:MAG TPA: N-acyl homoserine lactonase family protein [Terriglobia bacterium]|nr:N-acyl homoserine lactonase family protein [Terriglobia bacterium]